MATPGHVWKFFRAGGFDQVRLDSGDDLVHLGELDQKLWVALSCPTKGLEFDPKTLEAIDTDKDGRIRAPEILAATKWATDMVKNPDSLIRGASALPLSLINDKSVEGKALLASAKQILTNLGRGDAKEITLEDTADTAKIFAATRFNGDGVVPADSATDEPTQKAIADVITCLGGAPDRSGKLGVNEQRVSDFWTAATEYLAWWQKSEADPTLHMFGDSTATTMLSIAALRAKIDDYFTRCRLAAFDPRSVDALNRAAEDFIAIGKHELSLQSADVIALPLARIEAGKPLPLKTGLNPAFVEAIGELRDGVIKTLFGDRDALTDGEWLQIRERLTSWEAWQGAKAGAIVEPLGVARIKEILASDARAQIEKLIAEDKALEPEANSIDSVDRLIRYHKDLHRLLNNYISFRDFYTRADKAIFQAGTLYFDQRSCEMCMRVEDAARHAAVANLSRAYLVYCDLVRKGATDEKMQIVAAVTDGDSGDLAVGRNGIFYDRLGRDWDATVTKIVENPISIRQGFWAPYRKVAALVEEQANKFASARDKEVEAQAAAKVDVAAKTATTAAPSVVAAPGVPGAPVASPAPFDVAKFAGIFAAIGLAIGAIGGVLGTVFSTFFSLPIWELPFALFGLLLLLSGPSMLMAWLKLRQRNLGPLLDANGWAINTKARINIPFGRSLTHLAKLPKGAKRDLRDPYAEKTTGRTIFVTLALVFAVVWGAWYFGPLANYFTWLPKSGFMERKLKRLADQELAAKSAADKAAIDKKAADDKLAADKKAAEDKALADKKAADEKLAAEKKAAEEKAAADKKAADDKAALGKKSTLRDLTDPFTP